MQVTKCKICRRDLKLSDDTFQSPILGDSSLLHEDCLRRVREVIEAEGTNDISHIFYVGSEQKQYTAKHEGTHLAMQILHGNVIYIRDSRYLKIGESMNQPTGSHILLIVAPAEVKAE